MYLGQYLSQKTWSKASFGDTSCSRSSSSCSISTDEGLFEQPEPFSGSKAVMEKIIWRRSLQLRSLQQAWQVQFILINSVQLSVSIGIVLLI